MSILGDTGALNFAGTKIMSLRSDGNGAPRFSVTENEVLFHFDFVPAGVAVRSTNEAGAIRRLDTLVFDDTVSATNSIPL